MVDRRLEGNVVIITGGGHGIGRAYAKHLARRGAVPVIAEIDGEAARRVEEEIRGEGARALAVRTDVTSKESLARLVETVVGEFGRIDGLINNAAVYNTDPISRLPFDEIPVEEWDRLMNVNVKGTWLACRAVAKVMKAQRCGKIINVSSGSAYHGHGGRIHYVTSKAAIIGFTRTLARELGPFNICVNTLTPGNTFSDENPTEEMLEFRRAAARTRAIQRMQTPEDLVGAVAFLLSPDSDFVTGQTIIVDGGSVFH